DHITQAEWACNDQGVVQETFFSAPSTLHPKALDVWGVSPHVAALSPDPLHLDLAGRADTPLRISYEIAPPEYGAGTVAVAVRNGELLHDLLAGRGRSAA